MNKLFFIFTSLRPNVWIRIAAEMLLGASLVPHALNRLPELLLGFCILGPCIAGASYILNDITDKKYDSQHPLRRDRPIASNLLSLRLASITTVTLYLFALVISYGISLPLSIACLALIVSEILYTMHPFRYKEIFFLDIFLNAINASARFSSGFFLAGGNGLLFPFTFAAFAVLVKVILFLGHRWQNRNQERQLQFKSTVVVLSKKQILFVFAALGVLAGITYTLSIFEYSLPLYTFLYPLIMGVSLVPVAKAVVQVEKKENIRNYLYGMYFLFSLLVFFTAQK